MALIYITRRIPVAGISLLEKAGHTIDISLEDRPLTKTELLAALKQKPYDAVISLLTDSVDADIFDAVPTAKIFANYAVGFNNIDLAAAHARNVIITNTPGALTDAVAEHTVGLILSLMLRITEGDRFTRKGLYTGWAPELLLGESLQGKTLGLIGAGRIGARVAQIAHLGLGMQVIYTDMNSIPGLETEVGARFMKTPEEVLKEADVVSLHVPLLPSTQHLINAERLRMMKKSAYLINTSRGPVIDEKALVAALQEGVIRGAGLDVFEAEPALAPGLANLENVVITPHIASSTVAARDEMAEIAARNVIAVLEGKEPETAVKTA